MRALYENPSFMTPKKFSYSSRALACVILWTNLDETHVLRILNFAFSMQIRFFSQAWVRRHKLDFREIGNLVNGLMKNGGKKKGKSKREQHRKEERKIEG